MGFFKLASPVEQGFSSVFVELSQLIARADYHTLIKKSEQYDLAFNKTINFSTIQRLLPEYGQLWLMRGDSKKEKKDWLWQLGQWQIIAFLNKQITTLSYQISAHYPLLIKGYLIEATDNLFTIEGSWANKQLTVTTSTQQYQWRLDHHQQWSLVGNTQQYLEAHPYIQIVSASWRDYWQQGPEPIENTVDQLFAYGLDQALIVLKTASPHFYQWCHDVLLEIVPLVPLNKKGTRSGSFKLWPNLVSISTHTNIVETIVVLVHECSHQYFHLLQLASTLTKPDAKPCYSILKACYRPLDKVLLGFHAFANVWIILTELINQSALPAEYQYLIQHQQQSHHDVLSLQRMLMQQRADLTTVGLALFELLSQHLSKQGFFKP